MSRADDDSVDPRERRSLFALMDQHPDSGATLASVQIETFEQARRADAFGYDAFWLAEHHFQKLGTAANPAVLLSALAQCTERIRLGPAVSVLPLRNATQVAEDYALVDMLSGGRLNLGVGAGSRPLEFEGFGVDFEQRHATFEERLREIRQRFASGSLNVAPLQSPPPIYVATLDPGRAREIGRAGDSMLTLVSPATAELDEIRVRLEAHAEGLETGGHEGEAVVVVFSHAADSAEQARSDAAPAMARVLGALVGAAPPDPEPLYEAMKARGTGLFGSREEVAEGLERYRKLGAQHLCFVTHFGGMRAEAANHSLELLAPR